MKLDLLEGYRIAVDGLIFDDPTTYELLKECSTELEAATVLVDLIEIGARVRVRERSSADIDYLHSEVERMSEQLVNTLQERLSSADAANPLADFKEGSIEAIRQMAGQLSEHLRAHVERMAALESSVEGLRAERQGEAQVTAEYERGTAKGRDFEVLCLEAIAVMAAGAGDLCHGVGDVSSDGVGKAGDIVVEIGAAYGAIRGRVVFEAKGYRLAYPEFRRELDRAMHNRTADFAVLVCRGDGALPPGVEALQEVDGNKLCATLSPGEASLILSCAYRLARARVLMRRAGAEQVDVAALEVAIEKVTGAVSELRQVRSRLTNAVTAIEGAREILDAVEERVGRELQGLVELSRAS